LGLAVIRADIGRTLVVASHNPGKIGEIAELMHPLALDVISAKELDLPEPEETGSTFAENALIKAQAAARASGLPALADDSGLEVLALDREPGIYSARWAGPTKDFSRAMRNVEEKLQAKGALAPEERRAEFVCALSLCLPDARHYEFAGRVAGHLVWPPRGERGFGYDPMFQPDGFDTTFGEMDPARKHAISHRARAFRRLLEFLK
jgi:XTP/dITP diphosphohydrolase